MLLAVFLLLNHLGPSAAAHAHEQQQQQTSLMEHNDSSRASGRTLQRGTCYVLQPRSDEVYTTAQFAIVQFLFSLLQNPIWGDVTLTLDFLVTVIAEHAAELSATPSKGGRTSSSSSNGGGGAAPPPSKRSKSSSRSSGKRGGTTAAAAAASAATIEMAAELLWTFENIHLMLCNIVTDHAVALGPIDDVSSMVPLLLIHCISFSDVYENVMSERSHILATESESSPDIMLDVDNRDNLTLCFLFNGYRNLIGSSIIKGCLTALPKGCPTYANAVADSAEKSAEVLSPSTITAAAAAMVLRKLHLQNVLSGAEETEDVQRLMHCVIFYCQLAPRMFYSMASIINVLQERTGMNLVPLFTHLCTHNTVCVGSGVHDRLEDGVYFTSNCEYIYIVQRDMYGTYPELRMTASTNIAPAMQDGSYLNSDSQMVAVTALLGNPVVIFPGLSGKSSHLLAHFQSSIKQVAARQMLNQRNIPPIMGLEPDSGNNNTMRLLPSLASLSSPPLGNSSIGGGFFF